MSNARLTTSSSAAAQRILEGPLSRELLRFGAPLAIGMGLQTTFNLVDAYVISRLDSDVVGPSLGAIGICDQISALGSIVSYGVSTATAAILAQKQGRGDEAGVRKIAWQSMLMVAAWSVVFGVFGAMAARFILSDVVGAKGQVAELGTRYLRVMLGGSFSIFFLLQITAIQRSLGSSKTPVTVLILSNVLNLFLAVLMVYGPGNAPTIFAWGPPIARILHIPRMQLLGAAWATIIARSVSLLPLVIIVVRRFGLFHTGSRGGIDPPIVSKIWKIAWPSSAQLVVRICAMLVTQALVARAFTTDTDQSATTALGIVFRMETMALFVGLGWGSAAQTFVGQNLGAHNEERAQRSGWIASAYNLVVMAALALAYLQFSAPIVRFFDDDAGVIAVSIGYLKIVAPSYLALGVGIVLGSAMTGSGATRQTMLIDMGTMFGFHIPASIVAITLLHPTQATLWRVVAMTNCISAIVYIVQYRGRGHLRLRLG